MARKCGVCGQPGHNRQTCPHIEKKEINPRHARPLDTDCPYIGIERIVITYPWQKNKVSGVIRSIDYIKGNISIVDETLGKFYGFNWRTLDKHGIVVEIIPHGKKLKRRRKKRPNPEED